MPAKSPEYFMEEALHEARLSLLTGDWPIGCVIVHNDTILARGRNAVYSSKNRLAHAEMSALQQIDAAYREIENEIDVYTTYDPCPMCFGAMILSRIRNLYCGTHLDGSSAIYLQEHLPPLFKQTKFSISVTTNILGDECRTIFLQGEPTKKLIEQGTIVL